MKKRSKGFTLIELIVVMAILAILVTLAAPKFLGQTEKAHQTKLLNDAKVIEDACTMYNIEVGDWPRASDTPLTAAELAATNMYAIGDSAFKTPITPEVDANYYNIDKSKIDPYLRNLSSNINNFVLQNPVGTVYILDTKVAPVDLGTVDYTFGDDVFGYLDEGTGLLTIAGTGAMFNYDYGTSPIYNDRALIKSVTINSGVTSIGNNAFTGCSALTSITIPSSVTSIGDNAFYFCTALISITIPTSVASIGNGAFDMCTALISITIPTSVTSIGDMAFHNCSGLTSITIPSSVTSIGNWAFTGCSSLTSVTIPEGVISIGDHTFYFCTALTSITIPSSVASIGDDAFDMCTALISITIPTSVASIGNGAFDMCTALISITIPTSVTSIGNNAFGYCSALTSVTNNATINQTIGMDILYFSNVAMNVYGYSTNADFKTAVIAAGYAWNEL